MLKPDCLHRGDNNTLQPECAPATLTNFNAGNVVLRPRRNLPPALSALPGCGCKSNGGPICTPITTASVPDETLRPIAGPPDVYKPYNALQPFYNGTTCATATASTATSSSLPVPGSSWPYPTACPMVSAGRWTGFTCQCPGTAPMQLISLPSGTCAYNLGRNSISGSST